MRVLILAAAFAACPVVHAQEKAPQPAAAPEAGLPAGSALYGKHVDAIGGMDNLKAIKTLVTKARFTNSGAVSAPGRLEVYKEAPGRMYKLLDVVGMVTLETWCDGTKVWIRNSNTGVTRPEGAAATEIIQEASIVGELDYTTQFRELKTTGKESFAERECYAVQATGLDGKERTIYFDAQNGLILGARIPIPGGDKKLTLTMFDYQEFGGVKRPMKVVEDDGATQTTVTYHTVEVNKPVKVSFEPPAEVKDAK